MATIIGTQSPYFSQRSIVALLADSPQGYVLLNNALIDSTKRATVFGSAAVIRESGVSSLRVGDMYYVGHLPWWERVWHALALHPLWLAGMSTLVTIIFAWLLWRALLLTLLLDGHAVAATDVCHWPAWEQYQRDYISAEGRVIDPSTPSQITTSEGQSYGLFFALVANDRAMFEKLLQWTENNLASGDLSAHLPAWQWGKKIPQADDSPWSILDPNSASDADLWIAYNLLEAGRLWQSRRFLTLGTLLLQRIAHEEVAEIPGLGVMLLPGKVGFVHGDRWRLNPSYQLPQLLARFSTLNGPWKAMRAVNLRLLKESAPHGFSPDWVVWNKQQGWQADETKPNIGSYDAIRVYLWAAMLAQESEERAALVAHFQPMATLTAQSGTPPEQVNTATGKAQGTGSVGFSAALLPLLAAKPAARDIQRQRLRDAPPDNNAYFSASLTLFGQGWDEQRYQFNQQGELLPSWDKQCATSP